MVLGVSIGLLAGFYRGPIDSLLSRVSDVLMAFPGILLAIMVCGAFGDSVEGLFNGVGRLLLTAGAIAAVTWPMMARYVRGLTMQHREQGYIEAARASGAGSFYLIRTHILPNIAGMIVVVCSLDAIAVVANEATLSLLGLGVQQPQASLGLMINSAKDGLDTAPMQVLIPCAALVALVVIFALLGDGLRDVFDPRED